MESAADLAALRLGLSQGELVCPRKGQMAKGRCVQLQQEMACTCAVADAAGCALGDWKQPAPPAPPTPGELARREAIRAGLLKRRAATTTARPPAPPAEETTMPDTEKMLEAMRAEPERDFTRAELAELRGTAVETTGVALARLVKEGTVENTGRGLYRIVGGQEPAPPKPPAKKKAAAKKVATEKRPEQVEEDEVEPPSRLAKLEWLMEGLQHRFLSEADFIDQVRTLART